MREEIHETMQELKREDEKLKKAHLAVYNGGFIDPNTTLEPLILTRHEHGPGKGNLFYYVKTYFFNTISETANRTQIAYGYTKNEIFERNYIDGKWGDWKEYVSTAEMITNDNGYVVQYKDGTMRAWIRRTVTNVAINNAYGTLFTGNWTWNFPIPFIDYPIVKVGQARWGTGRSWGTTTSVNSNSATITIIDAYKREVGTNVVIYAEATGRWNKINERRKNRWKN